MTDWDAIVSAEPDDAGWLEICRRAEGMSDGEVTEVACHLREWPDRLRHMPDQWWAQRQAGGHRPWHRLATHRRLCQLWDDFYVSVAACPDDLSLLLAGSGATSNSDLGQVLLLRPAVEIESTNPFDLVQRGVAAALADEATAIDGQFSPDGSHVVVGFSDIGDPKGPFVYNADGELRFSFGVGGSESFGTGIFDTNFVRVGQNGDGRLVAGGNAAGGVAVAEAATGLMLLNEGATGPVALDQTGMLLAYACPSGQVAIRDVGSGELLPTQVRWTSTVGQVSGSFTPDGRTLIASAAPGVINAWFLDSLSAP